MQTRVWTVDPARPAPAALEEAVRLLRAGQCVAFPTDTVYGVGADLAAPGGLDALYAAKDRPAANPLVLLLADLGQATGWIRPGPALEALAARFWPGPLTLVVTAADSVPPRVTAGRPSVGLRVPDCALARALVAALGRPLPTTSANRSGGPDPRNASEVLAALGGRVPLLLDGGPSPGGQASTVLDLSVEPPLVRRAGPVSVEELRRVLPGLVGGPGTIVPPVRRGRGSGPPMRPGPAGHGGTESLR
jgi:L-threonylcarbamoyladenylate synthase